MSPPHESWPPDEHESRGRGDHDAPRGDDFRDRDGYGDGGRERPLFVLRPTFIGWAAVLSCGCPAAFCLFLGLSFLVALLSGGKVQSDLQNPYPLMIFMTAGLLLLGLAFLIVPWFTKKRSYALTEYRFYEDHIEYEEGFWTIERSSIEYRNIVEVYLRRSIVQKRYGLGTITLSTAGGQVSFDDIRHPDQVLERIQELIRQYREQA